MKWLTSTRSGQKQGYAEAVEPFDPVKAAIWEASVPDRTGIFEAEEETKPGD